MLIITINGDDQEYEVLDKYQSGSSLMLWCRSLKDNASKIADVTWIKTVRPEWGIGIGATTPEVVPLSSEEEVDESPLFKIYDYQEQRYLISGGPGHISWTDSDEKGSVFTEDIAKINMNLLANGADRSFLKLVPCDKNGKIID